MFLGAAIKVTINSKVMLFGHVSFSRGALVGAYAAYTSKGSEYQLTL